MGDGQFYERSEVMNLWVILAEWSFITENEAFVPDRAML